ncbi:MAG: hypothetical protein R2684_14580 [Pyrinomonadaceae bacterium]
MRICKLLLLVVLLSQAHGAFAYSGLQVTGTINNLEMVEGEKSIVFSFDTSVTVTNTGQVSVFILLPEMWWHIGTDVFGVRSDEKSEERLVFAGVLPSIDGSKEWMERKELLDAKTPPARLLTKLDGGESLIVEGKEQIYVHKEEDKYDLFIKNSLWAEFEKAKSLSLRLKYRVWSLNLEKYSLHAKKKFGRKLQKRWQKYGYLWLDDITTEPIPLDLRSASIKTEFD